MNIKLIMIILLVLISVPAWSVPNCINVQGKLTNRTTGSPITAPTSVTFDIWDSPSGGGRWFSETLTVTPDNNGVFDTILGQITPYPADSLTGDNYYLAISIGGSELTPRQRLVAVPFAITAKNLKGGIVDASGEVAVKGKGVMVGGSFESTASGSTALKGVSTAENSVGVYGKSKAAGGSFESYGTSGHGVWCSSRDPNKAGAYVQNTASGGRALEIGSGGIKVKSVVATIEAWGLPTSYDGGKAVHARVDGVNGAIGTINFPAPGSIATRWIGINNSYVKLGCKVFFTSPKYNNVTDWLITSNGKLWVAVYQGRSEAGFLQFIVIE